MKRFIRPIACAALLLAVPATGQAGPSLPQQELNLQVLDLNGAPFRHFHLRAYHQGILNPRTPPQALPQRLTQQAHPNEALGQLTELFTESLSLQGHLTPKAELPAGLQVEKLMHERRVRRW